MFVRSPYARHATLCALAGLLSTLAMAPFAWPGAALFAPWPLFALAHNLRNSVSALLGAGLLSSFFCTLLAFHWFLPALQNFGLAGPTGAFLIFVALAFVMQFKFVVFLVAFGLYLRGRRDENPAPIHRAPAWLWAALLGTLSDLLTPALFPWYWGNLLAASTLSLAQYAEFVGPGGLTFLLFALSYAACELASRLARGRPYDHRRLLIRAGLLIVVAAVLAAGGALRQQHWQRFETSLSRFRVAILQTGAPLETTGDDGMRLPAVVAAAETLINRTIPDLAREAARYAPDLIVLPESAVPYFTTDPHYLNRHAGLYHEGYRALVETIVRETGAAVLLNEINFRPVAPARESTGSGEARAFNMAALYTTGSAVRRAGEYRKHRLLPLGEYLPGQEFIASIVPARALPDFLRASRFFPGDFADNQALQVDSPRTSANGTPVRFLATICYEIIFSDYVRDFLNHAPADFLVNLTQDGWYGPSLENAQHFELARLRAIESRRALVRANNQGISAFVDLTGEIATPIAGPRTTRFTDRAVQVWDVPLYAGPPTLYMRFGHAWLWLVAALVGGIALYGRLRRRPL